MKIGCREANSGTQNRQGIPEEQESGQWRVCSQEIPPGRFRAQPRRDNSATKQLRVESRMCQNEATSFFPFIIHKGVFAKPCVKMRLLIAGNAVHFSRMFIKYLVVAGPEFKGKIGAQWNEAVELRVIPDRPWQTGEKNHGDGDQSQARLPSATAVMPVQDPAQQEWQERPEGGVCKERDSPKQSVENVLARPRRVRHFERGPQ